MSNNRISLTDSDFRTLISGGIVKQDGVEIALQDIGYDRMKSIIKEKENEDGSIPYFLDTDYNFDRFD